MKNVIRILATDELRPILESTGKQYALETEFFSDREGKIIEKISCMQPDVMIMNLFMPGSDAIEIIKAYRMLYAGSFTYFAVICPFLTGTLRRELDECRVNRTICSPFYKRDFLSMLAEVEQLKTTPLATLKSSGINTVHNFHHKREDYSNEPLDRPDEIIEKILDAFGINSKDTGRVYLKKAISLAIRANGAGFSVTKEIYPAVAAEFRTTPSCVERRIRCAITNAWKSGHSAVIAAYFGYTVSNMRGRPTNGEFIAMLADRIRMDMSNASDVKTPIIF